MNRWGKALATLSGVGALVGIGSLLLTLGERDSRWPKVALTLPEERAAAKAAGLPLVATDLPKRARIAESENAAPLYRQAIEVLPKRGKTQYELMNRYLGPKSQWLPDDEKKVDRFLRRSQKALSLAQQGEKREHCDFGWNWDMPEEGWKRRRDILQSAWDLSLLLFLRARRAIATNALQATLDTGAALRIANHLAEDGGIYVQDRHFMAFSLYSENLWQTLRQNPDVAAQLGHVAFELPTSSAIRALRNGWKVQFWKQLSDFERGRQRVYKPEREPFLDYNPLWRELDKVDFQLGWKLWADASEATNLRYWRKVSSALSTVPTEDALALWKALVPLDKVEKARFDRIPGYSVPLAYSRIAAGLVMVEAQARLDAVGVACVAFRQEKGRWPERLDELPAYVTKTDRLTGKAIGYRAPVLFGARIQENQVTFDESGDPSKCLVLRLDGSEAPGTMPGASSH